MFCVGCENCEIGSFLFFSFMITILYFDGKMLFFNDLFLNGLILQRKNKGIPRLTTKILS